MLCSLALATLALQDGPDRWMYADSRETDSGPRLELTLAGDVERTLEPDADTVLIGYLPDGAYGALPTLSINRADTNRVLLRFPLDGVDDVERAFLVLEAHQSALSTTQSMQVALRAATEAWSEARANWNTQPAVQDDPLLTFDLGPEEGALRVDVTALVQAWTAGALENHGLQLAIAVPAGPAPTPTGEAPRQPGRVAPAASEAQLLAPYAWHADVDAARAQAAAQGRHVLLLVTGTFHPAALTEQEELLLTTGLAHPVPRDLVARAFAPVRVHVSPNDYGLAALGYDVRNPFGAIDAQLMDVKPPALVIARPDGALVATLGGIGTFDDARFTEFLARHAPEGHAPEAPAPLDAAQRAPLAAANAARRAGSPGARALFEALPGEPEALYWLGVMAVKAGDGARARERWRAALDAEPNGPWAAAARAAQRAPHHVRAYVQLADCAPVGTRAERCAQGLAALLDSQLPNGSWAPGEPGAEPYRSGITVLCAHALAVAGSGTGEQAAAALARAEQWLSTNVVAADPARLNSFTATYYLDYLLTRHAQGAAGEPRVRAAVELLAGGQMRNGAWSYDKSWGEAWRGGMGWPATDAGRAHSMNTGIALEVLTRAADAGFAVDEDVLLRGKDALLAMRRGAAAYTYTWPVPDIYGEPKCSIGRAPACELALSRLGAADDDDLRAALEHFLRGRDTLEIPRKLTDSWLPPYALSGYFHSFAYYHAAQALAARGDAANLAKIQIDIEERVEPDGTWIDTPMLGKPYATAMALLVLRMEAR
jgi:hypothetical protein